MTKKINWRGPVRPMSLISLICIMGLIGCSEDPISEPVARQTIELRAGTPAFLQVEPMTRAVSWPTGYYDYSAVQAADGGYVLQSDMAKRPIAAFFTQDAPSAKADYSRFAYSGGKWRSALQLKKGTFYLYGFIPADEVLGQSIEPYTTTDKYSDGAVLTLQGLKTVSASDVCVIVGAKEGKGEETCPDLAAGQFETDIHDNSSDQSTNYIFLLFDHIYAGVRFSFKVDPIYNGLRTIHLKKLEIVPPSGKGRANATITVKAGEPVGVIESCAFGTPSGELTEKIFDDDLTLTTAASNFMACFMQGAFTEFTLKTTYDVYDKDVSVDHPDGNLVRKDCVAENKIKLISPVSLNRGEMITVNVTVKPTYVYVLSDPDLDNPTITTE